jgi:phosphoglycolate phosphatase
MPITVVFDLDGTLVDTAPDLINACNHVLGLAGVPAVPEAVLRPQISFGSRRMIVEGLAHHGRTQPAGEVDMMWATFLDYYAHNLAIDSRPYPHVIEVLERLAQSGVRLAVCTNKVEAHSRKLLAALDMAGRFAAICGRDTFPVCKPDPAHLLGTVALAGGNAARAIMVGDSDTDVSTARAAGIPIIGLTFGYTDIPMAVLRPDALIDSYAGFDAAYSRVAG